MHAFLAYGIPLICSSTSKECRRKRQEGKSFTEGVVFFTFSEGETTIIKVTIERLLFSYSSRHSDINLVEVGNDVVKDEDIIGFYLILYIYIFCVLKIHYNTQ